MGNGWGLAVDSKNKLVAIVGQTASGKTDLAIRIAKLFDGEIICGDSRTIYKCMDIGTAKPSKDQQKEVTHHMLDIIEPNEKYSFGQFKNEANKIIQELDSKNKLPIVVGGSGLYIDALLYDFDLDTVDARKLSDDLSLSKLQELSKTLTIKPTEQTLQNKQHLKRFIERNGEQKGRKPTKALVLGIRLNKNVLDERIIERVDQMLSMGLINEVKNIIKIYGDECYALMTPGYKPVQLFLNGEITMDEARLEFIKNDKKLAKRQQTWFKRNSDIVWIDDFRQAEQLIKEYLVQ